VRWRSSGNAPRKSFLLRDQRRTQPSAFAAIADTARALRQLYVAQCSSSERGHAEASYARVWRAGAPVFRLCLSASIRSMTGALRGCVTVVIFLPFFFSAMRRSTFSR
jgi:hypothetical protein